MTFDVNKDHMLQMSEFTAWASSCRPYTSSRLPLSRPPTPRHTHTRARARPPRVRMAPSARDAHLCVARLPRPQSSANPSVGQWVARLACYLVGNLPLHCRPDAVPFLFLSSPAYYQILFLGPKCPYR